MANKKIVILAGAGVLLLVVSLIIISLARKSGQGSQGSTAQNQIASLVASTQIPGSNLKAATVPWFEPTSYRLKESTDIAKMDYAEKQKLATFAVSAAALLQTYNYSDYGGSQSLLEHATSSGQTALKNYITQLQKTVKPGYRQYALADHAQSVNISFQDQNTFYITMPCVLYDVSNPTVAKENGKTFIELLITRVNKKLQLTNFSIHAL